jgi:hypothetical protein
MNANLPHANKIQQIFVQLFWGLWVINAWLE